MAAEALIAKGKERGFVTYEEITGLFPNPDKHLDEIDDLCISLIELGVEIVPAASLSEVTTSAESETKPEPRPAYRHDWAEQLDDLYLLYLEEIRQIPLLTRDDEIRLAKRIQRGIMAREKLKKNGLVEEEKAKYKKLELDGKLARHHFVEANLRLVTSIAWRYRDRGLPLLDLIQEGNMGLMKAVEKFDHRLGYRFSTYATWWIRQSINRAIADHSNIIRLPVHIQESYNKVQHTARELTNQLGRKPTLEQLAQSCGISKKRLERLLAQLPKVCSLDSLLCCPDFFLLKNEATRGCLQQQPCPIREFADQYRYRATKDDDFVLPPCFVEQEEPDYKGPLGGVDYSLNSLSSGVVSPEIRLSKQSLQKSITEVISSLSQRQRVVIELRFGLKDGEEQTLEQIGQRFGVTRERIRQIEAIALRKLRHPVRTRKLRYFLAND